MDDSAMHRPTEHHKNRIMLFAWELQRSWEALCLFLHSIRLENFYCIIIIDNICGLTVRQKSVCWEGGRGDMPNLLSSGCFSLTLLATVSKAAHTLSVTYAKHLSFVEALSIV